MTKATEEINHLSPGVLLDSPATGFIVVTEVGAKAHTAGGGDTDYRGFNLSDAGLVAGTTISTHWGMCEIVTPPARCRMSCLNKSGKREYGDAGTPLEMMRTLAAAKAMQQDLSNANIESVGWL